MCYKIMNQLRSILSIFIFLILNAILIDRALAQPAFLGLDIDNISFQKSSILSATSDQYGKSYNFTPVFSYAHYFKRNAGVGVKIGKNFSMDNLFGIQQNATSSVSALSDIEYSEKLYYFSAFVFEDFSYKNFYFNLSLNLDYRYFHLIAYKQTGYIVEDNVYYEVFNSMIQPKINVIGLNFRPATYYKLYNGFYAGLFFNMGISTEYKKGVFHNLNYRKRPDGSFSNYFEVKNQYNNFVSVGMSDINFGLSFIYRLKQRSAK